MLQNFSEKYSQTGCCFLCFSNVFLRARLVIVFYVFRMFSFEPQVNWREIGKNRTFIFLWCDDNIGRSRGQWKKKVISTLASNEQGYLFLVSLEFVHGSIGNQLNNVIFEIVTAKYSFLRWRVLFFITNWHIGHYVLKDTLEPFKSWPIVPVFFHKRPFLIKPRVLIRNWFLR